MKRFLAVGAAFVILGGIFFLLADSHDISIDSGLSLEVRGSNSVDSTPAEDISSSESKKEEAPKPASQTNVVGSSDIEIQSKLPSPPSVVKAAYLTGWSAGSKNKIAETISLANRTELNAVVIDIKDYSGYVSYAMNVPEVRASGALDQLRILRPNALIKALHDANIYVIGRVSVFQDPILAQAHPEWAIKNETTGKLWVDRKGLAWMDAAAEPVWDYNIAIAKDALSRGFDEINFDYVRFPSDGDMSVTSYPFWDEVSARRATMRKFFSYVREKLPNDVISADLFGLATINRDDLGIGQVIEDAYRYFDYICPMIYPSHYAAGFLGYKNPAANPYEVIKYSMERAIARLYPAPSAINASSSPQPTSTAPIFTARLRPWLQDFNLGATYTAEMVRKQIDAVEEVTKNAPTEGQFTGWLLWDPSNTYTEGALRLGEVL